MVFRDSPLRFEQLRRAGASISGGNYSLLLFPQITCSVNGVSAAGLTFQG
jgi:hypothetical protein